MLDSASGCVMAPGEDVRESSCRITYSTLPKITMIDLPFFASTTESAFSTLGGIELIKNLVRDGAKNMSLKFPSSNALQGSIVGEKVSTGGGLLLRVRRRKEKPVTGLPKTPCENDVQITAVGRVDSMYVFNQPSDYQFLPETNGLLNTFGPQDTQRILEIIPRPFCRTQLSMQTDLLFKELNFDPEKYSRKKRETGQYHQIKFGDPIPQELNAAAKKAWEATARTGTKLKIAEVKMALIEKLKEKPIWKKKQLDLYEPFKTLMYVFFEVLPLFSFGYISGPFKGYIVRYGYDPAIHPESRFLQVLHFRMIKREYDNLKQRLSDHVGLKALGMCIDLDHMTVYANRKYNAETSVKGSCIIIFLGIEFKQQQSFQVCDLIDEDIMQFVQKMKRFEVCGKDGWFHLGAITIIRDKFKEFVIQKIEEFLSKPRYCKSVPDLEKESEYHCNENNLNGNDDGDNNNENNNNNNDDIDHIEMMNNIKLGERMKYWQDRYLKLPDAGIATEADIIAFENYYESHKRRGGMKSHRLQRIFRMVGRSLLDPKNGKNDDKNKKNKRVKEFDKETTMGNRKKRKRKKESLVSSDSENSIVRSDEEDYDDGDDNDRQDLDERKVGRRKESKRKVSFSTRKQREGKNDSPVDANGNVGKSLSRQDRSRSDNVEGYSNSTTSTYNHRDASVYIDDDDRRSKVINSSYSSNSNGGSNGRDSSRSKKGIGAEGRTEDDENIFGLSSSGLNAVEAFSFFDEDEEVDDDEDGDDDDDDDDDDPSDAGSDYENEINDVADPFGTAGRTYDAEEEDEEREPEPDSAWL